MITENEKKKVVEKKVGENKSEKMSNREVLELSRPKKPDVGIGSPDFDPIKVKNKMPCVYEIGRVRIKPEMTAELTHENCGDEVDILQSISHAIRIGSLQKV